MYIYVIYAYIYMIKRIYAGHEMYFNIVSKYELDTREAVVKLEISRLYYTNVGDLSCESELHAIGY